MMYLTVGLNVFSKVIIFKTDQNIPISTIIKNPTKQVCVALLLSKILYNIIYLLYKVQFRSHYNI